MTSDPPIRVSIIVEASDDALVERAMSGSDAVFESLVDRYYGRCLRFAWRQFGNREDAEEAVQDAFLRPRSARSATAAGRNGFRSWLMAIVVNSCRTYRGMDQTRRALLEQLSIGAAVHGAPPSGSTQMSRPRRADHRTPPAPPGTAALTAQPAAAGSYRLRLRMSACGRRVKGDLTDWQRVRMQRAAHDPGCGKS